MTDGRRALRRWSPWGLGLVLAVALLGPALAPGPLLNLDLVLPPDVPVPRGVWGLGPELPRRVPLWLPVAWLSPVIGGDTAGKAMMIAAVAVAFVGAYRMVVGPLGFGRARSRSTPAGAVVLAGIGAGLLYAAGPFVLTRLAVGHLMIVVPMAVLPWVLPTLVDPGASLRRTFLAAAALGVAGHYGGAVAVLVVAVGLVATRGRRLPGVVAVTLAAQVPWLLPGLVVYGEGANIVDAVPFTTAVDGVAGVGQLLAGHGFWQPLYQVGGTGGWPVAAAGVVLAALGIAGTPSLPSALRRPLVALAAIGAVAAVASATPGLGDLYVSLSRNPIGSVVREGQRLLPLYLLWMAPAAALGGLRLSRWLAASAARTTDGSATDPTAGTTVDAAAGSPPPPAWRAGLAGMAEVLCIVLALWLASPGLWGLDDRLRPVELPAEYASMRERIEAEPGPVLALPWHQYFNLEVDGIRRVLGPLPLYLGGDVLVSSDPELAESDRRERVDPRERAMDAVVADTQAGVPPSERLRALGVRWVAVLHEVDWLSYEGLSTDPGLERVLHEPALDLYEVRDWSGMVVDAEGRAVPSSPVVEPLRFVDASGPAVYRRPYASGWMRGTSAASATPDGLVALPAGSGPVWYWPSVVVVLLTVAVAVAAVAVGASLWRERRREPPASAEAAAAGRDDTDLHAASPSPP